MKIPIYIKNIIIKMAKLHSQCRREDFKLSKWLDKNGIEFDAVDTLGCSYSLIQDGFPDDFINKLEELEVESE